MRQGSSIKETEIIRLFEEFLRDVYYNELIKATNSGSKSLFVDFSALQMFSADLADAIEGEPKKSFENLHKALKNIDLSRTDLNLRFINIPQVMIVPIRNIRSEHIGRLIAIEGTIRNCSDVRPVSKEAIFECVCGAEVSIKQVELKLKEPDRCPKNCMRPRFKLARQILVDKVNLTVEESPEMMEGGEQPNRLSAFLEEDLVSPQRAKMILPGNKVRLIGILKEYVSILRSGGMSTHYEFILQTNNVEPIEKEFESIEITQEDEEKILEMSKDEDIYNLFRNSISPNILGYDEIKDSLVLQIFGGVRKERKDGTKSRGDVHILLVGDPGTGKSQMLTYMNRLAPKSVYVTGKGTSAAGLTATVIKDEIMKDWVLEAGALVLANKGIAVVDEFDKMDQEDRVAMHEAMAQQTVTINKANIHATLNAQTSVLAAANPKLGRFDPYSPITEQINLQATLINRFDLIFTVRDLPDIKKDEKIARHVLNTHRRPKEIVSSVDASLFRKYVAYAKKNCHPDLSDDAVNKIVQYYVKLRSKKGFDDKELSAIPISARQLEALIRLAEANARVRLSPIVDTDDAKKAIELLQYSMNQVGIDPETGELDIDRIVTGITQSQRNRIITFKEILKTLEAKFGDQIPTEEVMKEAKEKGIDEGKTEELLGKMKKNGEIYEPRHGIITRMK